VTKKVVGDALCVFVRRFNHVIEIPASSDVLSPILTTIPLQLLSYHIAVLRGCNVDQPQIWQNL
jgi:glucosamine 6-phosphate synthetase-like amidotransferase/phosphosugar isomerase protein